MNESLGTGAGQAGVLAPRLRYFRTAGLPGFLRRFAIVPGIPMVFILVLIVVGVTAPWISPHDPLQQRLIVSNTPPAWTAEGNPDYYLGTDRFGRDQLSRIIHGARISLTVSVTVILIGGSIGVTLGLIAGYFGKGWDALIMRIVDVKLAFPSILLAMVLATVLGPSFGTVILVMSLTIWPFYARLVRGEVLGLREQDFVVYARTIGVWTPRLFWKHLFPNIMPSVLVVATAALGTMILLESSLSFLGVGIPPPAPSWGTMVLDGRGLLKSAWWISFFPGLAIFLTVFSFTILGDWLRDWADPKRRVT